MGQSVLMCYHLPYSLDQLHHFLAKKGGMFSNGKLPAPLFLLPAHSLSTNTKRIKKKKTNKPTKASPPHGSPVRVRKNNMSNG